MIDDNRPTIATGDFGRGSRGGSRGGSSKSNRRQDDDDLETRYADDSEDGGGEQHTMVRSSQKPEIKQVAWLYCKVGKAQGRLFQIKKVRTLIGRADECDVIVDDAYCGGRHGAIILNEGVWEVHDFASKNGTFANGQRLGKDLLNPSEIQDNDRIQIGDTEFIFKCIEPD